MTVFLLVTSVLLIVSAAFCVDLGREVLRARDLRTIADLASLDAARLIDGSPTAALAAPVTAAAYRSLARNDAAPASVTLTVTLGTWDAATETFTATAAAAVPDAVKVDAVATQAHFFIPGSVSVARSATATRTSTAGVWTGAPTAPVDATGAAILNGLLSRTLGGAVNASAAQWQALQGASVDLMALTGAAGVGATDLGRLLAHPWTTTGFMLAVADAIGPGPAATELHALAVGVSPSSFTLGQVVSVATVGRTYHLVTDVLAMVRATSLASVGGPFTVTGLTLAGAGTVTAAVAVTSVPVVAFGRVGTSAPATGAVLLLTVEVPVPGVGGTPTMTVPLGIEFGRGTATLSAVDCDTAGALAGAGATVATGTGRAYTGAAASVGAVPSAALVLTVPGTGTVDLVGATGVPAGAGSVSFTAPFGIALHRSVATAPFTPSGLAGVTVPQVTLDAGQPASAGTDLADAVTAALAPVLADLDPFTTSVQHALDTAVGGADTAALDAACSGLALAR